MAIQQCHLCGVGVSSGAKHTCSKADQERWSKYLKGLGLSTPPPFSPPGLHTSPKVDKYKQA